MVVIKVNGIFNTRDTTHERQTPEEAECLDDIGVATYTMRNRKKTSIVWQELATFKLADRIEKCNDGTTTQYKRYLDSCVKRQVSLKGQGNLFLPPQAPRSDSVSGIQTWKYDQAKIRELPFAFTEYELFTLLMKIASLHYVRISRATAKANSWTSYEVEKKRMCITTNMWKLGQKIQDMVLTTHFVDSDWNLQKKSGVLVYDALYKCLQDWGIEGKVCSIFVDNASYNDATVRMLKDSFSFHKRLPLNGKLFYVRCCAHILNLLVHDGLFEIEDVIDNEVCSFFALFNEVTNIISGSEYPTSNLFLPKLWSIKELLMEKSLSEELWMRQIADKMKRKFDQYWGEFNFLISIAAILHPRNMMKLIYFNFRVIYFEEEAPRQIHIVHDSLYELYKAYVDEYATSNVGKRKVMTGRSKFERYIRRVDIVKSFKSELDIYLEEGVFICKENCGDFNALEWWKVNNLKFRILSKMTCEILSIPITMVASESTFSGGRVIDAYHSSLRTDTMQMLLYGFDWYQNFYGLKKKAKVSNF
uniref:HAT C-terminal dimerisation domain-containing protein n=1 Tax=Gossypium raimondii TaxID=29730 RepID=A0A0D2NY67_GOSRA|nr:hypothetical protein B456_003G080400 [Gossypium raimondii]